MRPKTLVVTFTVVVTLPAMWWALGSPEASLDKDFEPTTIVPLSHKMTAPRTGVDEGQRAATALATATMEASLYPISAFPASTTAVNHTTLRYLMFNPLYPWYGLTNQMMCYAAAIRYAMHSHRAMVPPEKDMVARFTDLFDLDATNAALTKLFHTTRTTTAASDITAPLIISLKDVPTEFLPPTSMNKKNLYLPQREVFHSTTKAKAALQYLSRNIERSKGYRAIRHHNFFMRFPWVPEMAPLDEGAMFASLVFHSTIVRYAAAIKNVLPPHYLALHLRLENDAKLIRSSVAVEPTSEQFHEFLKKHVAPLVGSTGAKAVYLCTGKLSEQMLRSIEDWNKQMSSFTFKLWLKSEIQRSGASFPPIPTAVGRQRDAHAAKKGVTHTQDHYQAAVDLLLMESATAAVLPDYSTFRFAVYGRRCGLAHVASVKSTNNTGGVQCYKLFDSGQFSPLTPYGCDGRALGWAGHKQWGSDPV